jgi:hypothetical protein
LFSTSAAMTVVFSCFSILVVTYLLV